MSKSKACLLSELSDWLNKRTLPFAPKREEIDLFEGQSCPERILMEAFPMKIFVELGLMRTYPRMYRGVPRLYHRTFPTRSCLRSDLAHAPTLRRRGVLRPLFSLYSEIPVSGRVGIWEGPHAKAWEEVLSSKLPNVTFSIVSEWDAGFDAVLRFSDDSIEEVGQESYGLGLHCLEQGLFAAKYHRPIKPPWHKEGNRFYFAFLPSSIGGAMYISSLLQSLQKENRNIDLYSPHLEWLIHLNATMWKELGIATLQVEMDSKIQTLSFSKKGKTLRIFSSPQEVDERALLAASDPWPAVGDAHLGDSIKMGVPFFYEGKMLQDLVALAENRLMAFPALLSCIRSMGQGILPNRPTPLGDWVDETFFQTGEEWPFLAQIIGEALQDPTIFDGYRELSQIIRMERLANSFAAHLVQRALSHKLDPQLQLIEEKELVLFTNGEQSFSQFMRAQRMHIAKSAFACMKSKT